MLDEDIKKVLRSEKMLIFVKEDKVEVIERRLFRWRYRPAEKNNDPFKYFPQYMSTHSATFYYVSDVKGLLKSRLKDGYTITNGSRKVLLSPKDLR